MQKPTPHLRSAWQSRFIPMFRTGLPESSAPHLRYARQPRFPPQPRHRDTGKFSAALALREATTVSSATSTPGHRKVQRRTCVTRGSHGFLRAFDTGIPESSVPHLRYARQPRFPPQPRHRDTGKFSAALALREAAMVSSAPSNRATAICVSVGVSIRL